MSITQDVAFSLRLMRKAPLFTAAVVLTIGLAIAATATIFSVVNAQMLRPLPFKDPDRLLFAAVASPGRGLGNGPLSNAGHA